MHTYITPHIFTICLCLLSTATILGASSSSSKRSPAKAASTAKRQRLTVYSYSPSTMPASAMAAQTTLAQAVLPMQPSFDADSLISTFGDTITLLRIAAAQVVMQPRGIYIEPRLSGKKYLDTFAPLTDLQSPTFNLYHLNAQWQTLIEAMAECPDLSLVCKQADDFITQLERNRVHVSFDFAARTLLAKAHRLANAGLHALEQKDHAQAKEHLHHATILYYRLQPINFTTKVIYNTPFALDSCIVLPDLTPDFMRLQTCLRIMGTVATDAPITPVLP